MENDTINGDVLLQLAGFARQAQDIHAQWESVLRDRHLDLGLAGFTVGTTPLVDGKRETCTGYWNCGTITCKYASPCSCTPCDCSTTCTPSGRGTADDDIFDRLKRFEGLLPEILPDWDDILAQRDLDLHLAGYVVSAPDSSWDAARDGWRTDMAGGAPCIKAPGMLGAVVVQKANCCC